jgi:radical SAM protein with 4Fe4S-binding SPASM domain
MNLFTIIEIETHNRCTRHCWFCKFGQARQDQSTKSLPDELIEKIADNLHDLDFRGRISPFGINEPLLDPRLPEIIRLFRAKCPQALISLASNGDLLTEELYQTLVAAGLDGLLLSVYDSAAWRRLVPYIKYPNIRLNDMRFPARCLENRGGGVKRTRSSPATADVQRPCLRPFSLMVIRCDGNVSLCCSDMYGEVVMGDIANQRLEEIWHSSGFRHYRARLASSGREGLKLCQTCSHDGTPVTEQFPLDFHRSFRARLENNFKQPIVQNVHDIIMRNLPERWIPKGMDDIINRYLLKRRIRQQRDKGLWDW